MKQKESREEGASTKLVWLVVAVMSLCLTFMGPSASQALITQTMKTSIEPTDDHGDIAEEATLIQPNSVTSGAFHDWGDVDYFKVELSENGILAVFTASGTDTEGNLEDENYHLASDDNSGSGENFRIAEYLEAGIYYVALSGRIERLGEVYDLVCAFVADETANQPLSTTDHLDTAVLSILESLKIGDGDLDVENLRYAKLQEVIENIDKFLAENSNNEKLRNFGDDWELFKSDVISIEDLTSIWNIKQGSLFGIPDQSSALPIQLGDTHDNPLKLEDDLQWDPMKGGIYSSDTGEKPFPTHGMNDLNGEPTDSWIIN